MFNKVNKEKLLFYIFLAFLVLTRIKAIINTMGIIQEAEPTNIFISSCIAKGLMFSRIIFQPNMGHVGGGHLIYNIISAPLMIIFGTSYFSLRLASIIFLVLIYSLTYKFCNKYFGLKTVIFTSLLFIFANSRLTKASIIGDGRHFDYNLFFILSLYFLTKIKERETAVSYLIFGLICGIGVYFEPAFLATVFIFWLFFFWEIYISSPTAILKYLFIITPVTIAVNFLFFGLPWNNLYFIRDLLIPRNNIFSIYTRPFFIFFDLPKKIFFANLGIADNFSQQFLKTLFLTYERLSAGSFGIIHLIFIASFVSLCSIYGPYLKKLMRNSLFFSLKKDYIPVKEYTVLFLLLHLVIYVVLFSFVLHNNYLYYTPLLLNTILIVGVFLNEIWQRNKYLALSLLCLVLLPGLSFQYVNLKAPITKDFYKHYIYFYDEDRMVDYVINKPISVHKVMCDKLGKNICRTLGIWYCDHKENESLEPTQKNFEYLSAGNMVKLRYLYQSYIRHFFVNKTKGDIKETLSVIGKIDKRYRNFCYIGLGEGLVFCHRFGLFPMIPFNEYGFTFEFDFEKDKKMVEGFFSYIREDYKRYLFRGIGEGIAKRFAVAYSPYITKTNLYDETILDKYSNMISDKEYKNAFLLGFFNKDIWD